MVEVEALGVEGDAQLDASIVRAERDIAALESRARHSNRRILKDAIKQIKRAAPEKHTVDEVIDDLRRELQELRRISELRPALDDDNVVISNLQQELTALHDQRDAQAPPVSARRYSSKSANTLKELAAIEQGMAGSEKLSDGAEVQLGGSPSRPLLRAIRSELARAHGDCTKLLSTGGALQTVGHQLTTAALDVISTGELVSGQEDARTLRKALVVRVEALSSRLEDQVNRIDQLLAVRKPPKPNSGRK